MFKHSMLFGLGLLAAAAVHAADADGFYVSAGLGQSQVSFDGTEFNTNSSPSPLTTVDASKSGTTHLLFIGGEYALTPQLAVVGKYTVFGVMGDEDAVGRSDPQRVFTGIAI